MELQSISLFELNNRIKDVLSGHFNAPLWVVGEISEMNVNRTGHCYLELIEKEVSGDKIIARARANIWAFTWRMLKPYFETTTGRTLASGLKVMVNVSVSFHELYGYSLNITDIDPNYTLGDLVRKRMVILKKLEDEGVIDMNRELFFPELPKNIAIISSPTAAGLGDFINQLENNERGYKFHYHLFEALMQGEKMESSVVDALEKINENIQLFDVVVIIRGGGARTELSDFDSYWLAYNIAQFPIPVLTGIGHERDESIADRVAHKSLKNPTAVAEFLVSAMATTDEYLEGLAGQFHESVSDFVALNNEEISNLANAFMLYINNELFLHKSVLSQQIMGLTGSVKKMLNNCSHRIEIAKLKSHSGAVTSIRSLSRELERKGSELKPVIKIKFLDINNKLDNYQGTATLSDPEKILERGFSITRVNGKILNSCKKVLPGDMLETILNDGVVTSQVTGK
ncbi:MAG: exodeoxyribonuclease VII large subunit [Bacteroidetes bacterium GWF2_38_335]|nr:MAG: exodeoxyribonuclease VII large subunit [Bacteroidetes bacterium GWF2_38_335]OFY77472.1 MAG: exodeoxyribonuclease VII large subunit [Bacteroidetes bacterium RIFOXYA12_FULL_38_20]HBS87236.1 exodeoxyribonuclease VII large subunit [Bacteroidales bacterium]